MVTLTKSLILSVTLATLALAAPASTHDPCTHLGSLDPINVKYENVAACLHYIPFNQTNAAATLDTMYKLYDGFSIFKDYALTPNLELPFTSPPVYILAEFKKIGNTKYTSDYAFHNDIQTSVKKLNDAHSAYYSTFPSPYY
jgi:hypothetical protein